MLIRFDNPQNAEGTLSVPPSKSYTHRALLTALCAGGGRVEGILCSADTEATLNLVQNQSRRVERSGNVVEISSDDPFRWIQDTLFVGESGTLLRFLLPLCTVLEGPETVLLRGEGSLLERSNRDLLNSIRENSFQIEGTGSEETIPITCHPGQGVPQNRTLTTVASTTSQLLSGWMIALAARGGGKVRRTTELVSAPYVEMTRTVLHQAGFTTKNNEGTYTVEGSPVAMDYRVPGDFSSASFWIVAGALGEGPLRLQNLEPEDPQADRYVVELLQKLGQDLRWEGEDLVIGEGNRPAGFRIDAGDCPDLVPILATFAVFAEGVSRMTGIAHLGNKESDRINRTAEELRKTGVRVVATENSLTVDPTGAEWYPGLPVFSSTVRFRSHNDHRLAMSFSVLGMLTGNAEVEGAECVEKSYPDFYQDAEQLGIRFSQD